MTTAIEDDCLCPTVPPPPEMDPPPFDDGGGDLIPLHSVMNALRDYGSVPFVARLVEKWTTRGFRAPCGRMWRLPVIVRERKRWVPIAAAKEFVYLIGRNSVQYPDPSRCQCPKCLALEYAGMELASDPHPPTAGRTPPVGYLKFWLEVAAIVRQQPDPPSENTVANQPDAEPPKSDRPEA